MSLKSLSNLLRQILLIGALCAVGLLEVHSQGQTQVGYTVVTADPGAVLPAAAALFSYSNAQGVLVSEAAAAGVEPTRAMSIFVDEAGTQTGIALVNPSLVQATLTLTLRDATGLELARSSRTLSSILEASQPLGGTISTEVTNSPPQIRVAS